MSDSQDSGHPLDAALKRRASADAKLRGGGAATPSSPESGEVEPAATKANGARDFDTALAAASSSSSSGSDAEPAEPAAMQAPAGVLLVESGEERNAEVARLLRAPRYFDENYEEAGARCFKCGGKGHFARDCTAEAKERSCFLCAKFGHDSRDCPNSLCWRCQRPGHMARDCPYGHRQQASWDDAPLAVCLRCGSESCPCAGEKDLVRADGGCKREYAVHDLRHVRCYTCGKRGHLSCAAAPTLAAKLSCCNCGQGGHSAVECPRDLPPVMRGERLGGSSASQSSLGNRGAYGSSGRFSSYTAYADIDTKRSYGDVYREPPGAFRKRPRRREEAASRAAGAGICRGWPEPLHSSELSGGGKAAWEGAPAASEEPGIAPCILFVIRECRNEPASCK